jgi:hypothetical protein
LLQLSHLGVLVRMRFGVATIVTVNITVTPCGLVGIS